MNDQQVESFQDTPQDQQRRWVMEIEAAQKWLAKWQEMSAKIVKRFTDDREDIKGKKTTRLCMYSANVIIIQSAMYDRIPNADVSRRFADASDDTARVAGEMMERMLNCDVERVGDGYASAVGLAFQDFLLGGLGVARCRYVADTEQTEGKEAKLDKNGNELAPAVPPGTRKISEDVETDYVYWGDFLYSPCRTWREKRWLAFKTQMKRDALVKRFGKEIGSRVPLDSPRSTSEGTGEPDSDDDNAQKSDPWARATVWEIWDGEEKKVVWIAKGMDQPLDTQDDPLQLEGFYPCDEPLIANPTTSAYKPTPDYKLAQDLYEGIDKLSTRIDLLEGVVKVGGVYDPTIADIKTLVNDTPENTMIPSGNFALFAEHGGLKGCVDWMPIDMIAAVLAQLRDMRSEKIQLLLQITGIGDIIRGQQTENGTPGEAQVKARFASARLNATQSKLAKFATGIMRIRAEIIAKHFDPETIIERSNAQFLPEADRKFAMAAAQLIKDRYAAYRIEVKADSMSAQDFAALKSEALEVLEAISQFLQMAMPMAQQMPGAMPFLLQMLQAMIAKLRGSKQLEGILDEAVAAATQAAQQAAAQPQQQPQQDMSKVQAAQIKATADLQKVQLEAQARSAEINQETEALRQRAIDNAEVKVREATAIHRLKGGQPGMPSGPSGAGPGGGPP